MDVNNKLMRVDDTDTSDLRTTTGSSSEFTAKMRCIQAQEVNESTQSGRGFSRQVATASTNAALRATREAASWWRVSKTRKSETIVVSWFVVRARSFVRFDADCCNGAGLHLTLLVSICLSFVDWLNEWVPLVHPGAEPKEPHGERSHGDHDICDFGIVLGKHSGRSAAEDNTNAYNSQKEVGDCSADHSRRDRHGHFRLLCCRNNEHSPLPRPNKT